MGYNPCVADVETGGEGSILTTKYTNESSPPLFPHYSSRIARILILIVLLWNLQCAAAFLLWPSSYAGGFELQGMAGAVMLQGMGLLFVMWNVPYGVAASDPVRQRMSLYEATAMQALGFLGEGMLLLLLPTGHATLGATVGRFLWFDGFGLVLLVIALMLTRQPKA